MRKINIIWQIHLASPYQFPFAENVTSMLQTSKQLLPSKANTLTAFPTVIKVAHRGQASQCFLKIQETAASSQRQLWNYDSPGIHFTPGSARRIQLPITDVGSLTEKLKTFTLQIQELRLDQLANKTNQSYVNNRRSRCGVRTRAPYRGNPRQNYYHYQGQNWNQYSARNDHYPKEPRTQNRGWTSNRSGRAQPE